MHNLPILWLHWQVYSGTGTISIWVTYILLPQILNNLCLQILNFLKKRQLRKHRILVWCQNQVIERNMFQLIKVIFGRFNKLARVKNFFLSGCGFRRLPYQLRILIHQIRNTNCKWEKKWQKSGILLADNLDIRQNHFLSDVSLIKIF